MTTSRPDAPASAAPPVQPAPMLPPRPAWPKVIGIISILLGSLGMIQGIGGVLGTVVTSMMSGQFGTSMPGGGAIAAAEQWRVPLLIIALGLIGLGGLLLTAGIGMVQRRRWCVRLAFLWCVLKVIIVPFDRISQARVDAAAFESMASDPTLAGAVPMGMFGNAFTNASAIVGTVYFWIFPIFLAVWLLLPRSRKEILTWAEPSDRT